MRILIATTKVPLNSDEFVKCLHRHSKNFNVKVTAARGMLGPGCYNLGVAVEGLHDDAKEYANALTLALFPARWTETTSEFEGFLMEDLK